MEELEMIRGDYKIIPIRLKKNGTNYQLLSNENIIFSVKKNSKTDEYILQKRLNEGIYWDDKEQAYFIELTHQDTKDISLKKEVVTFQCDIVIILDGDKPITKKGTLSIERDITRNEFITQENGLTDEQIKALDEMTFEINENGEFLVSYDKGILDIDFYIENNDLIISQDIDVDFNINEKGELEVTYERNI